VAAGLGGAGALAAGGVAFATVTGFAARFFSDTTRFLGAFCSRDFGAVTGTISADFGFAWFVDFFG